MSLVSGIATIKIVRGSVTLNLGVSTDLLTSFVETKDLDGGDPLVRKFVEALMLEMTHQSDQSSARAILKIRENAYEEHTEGDSVSLARTNEPVFVRPPGAHYIRLRIQDAAVVERWKLSRITAYGSVGGKFF